MNLPPRKRRRSIRHAHAAESVRVEPDDPCVHPLLPSRTRRVVERRHPPLSLRRRGRDPRDRKRREPMATKGEQGCPAVRRKASWRGSAQHGPVRLPVGRGSMANSGWVVSPDPATVLRSVAPRFHRSGRTSGGDHRRSFHVRVRSADDSAGHGHRRSAVRSNYEAPAGPRLLVSRTVQRRVANRVFPRRRTTTMLRIEYTSTPAGARPPRSSRIGALDPPETLP